MKNLVAVTGAAGFLGREIVARLAKQGHAVRAVTRDGQPVEGARENVAAGDLAVAELHPLVEGCGAVIHCAARVHVLREGPAEAEIAHRETNALLPPRLARTAREAGASRFVQLSSVAAVAARTPAGATFDDHAEPCPTGPYGRSKLAADRELEALSSDGFTTVSLRPPTVFGPGVKAYFAMFDRAARAGVPLPLAGIANRRSMAFLGNIADAVVTALRGPSGSYLVTDSEPCSTADLYRRLLRLHGYGDRVFALPTPLVYGAARAVLGDRADSLLGDAAFDGARFAADFGWTPPTPLDKALALTVGARRS